MAVTHETATRNGIADYVVDQLDSGNLVLKTAASGTVATLPFAATAFGAASSGTAAIPSSISDTSAAGGVAATAEFQKSDTTVVLTCGVGTGSSDINLSSTTIGATDTVTITSLTYTAPV